MQIHENIKANVIFTTINDETIKYFDMFNDEIHHIMLAKVKQDPINYKEAIQIEDKVNWKYAIDDELKSIERNIMWKILDRPTKMSNGQR